MIHRRRRAPLHVESLESRRLLSTATSFTITALDASASEANLADTAKFRVTRNGDLSVYGKLRVDRIAGPGYATTPADYSIPELAAHDGSYVEFQVGQDYVDFTIHPKKDNLVEGTESVRFNLTGYIEAGSIPTQAIGTATATIADDPPTFTIETTDPTATEGIVTDTAAFKVKRFGGDPASSLSLTLSLAAGGPGLATPPGQSGADYTLAGPGLSGTVGVHGSNRSLPTTFGKL